MSETEITHIQIFDSVYYNTECQNCGAKFHTDDDDEIGTTVECPQCSAPVKAVV